MYFEEQIGEILEYELRQIDGEQWLVEMPETSNDVNDLAYALENLFLEPKGERYLLKIPSGSNRQEIILKLIDALIYEINRHNWDSPPCLHRRRAIQLLDSSFKGAGLSKYKNYLKEAEREQKRYFGDNLSDNSDQEDNNVLRVKSEKFYQNFDKMQTAQSTSNFWYKTKRITPRNAGIKDKLQQIIDDIESGTISKKDTIREKIDDASDLLFKAKENVSEIPYSDMEESLSSAQLKAIKKINDIIFEGRENNHHSEENKQTIHEILEKNKLFIAQYRGINYLIDRWNAPSRRYHRKMQEIGLPQYCAMVLQNLEFNFYTQLNETNDYATQVNLQEKLGLTNAQVKQFLLDLRETDPVIDYTDRSQTNLYLFNNILEKLQHSYSNGIDEFLKELDNLRDQYPDFWGTLPNACNPFVSTGNTALHALKYAYGMKEYYKNPLRPRYNQDGSIEYSHVGKVYLSLHRVEDWLFSEPNNVPQMDREGRIQMDMRVAPEKETSFLSNVDGDEVVYHYVAKFPDFSSDFSRENYPPIYELKYGLDYELFNQFKYLIRKSSPEIFKENDSAKVEFDDDKSTSRSRLRSSVRDLLGTWLCTYHSVLLTRIAFKKAQSQGGILVFLGRDGLLTNVIDKETLNSSKENVEVRTQAHIHRQSRHQIATKLSRSPQKRRYHGFSLINSRAVEKSIDNLNTETVSQDLKGKDTKRKNALNITPEQVDNEKSMLRVYSSPHTPLSNSSNKKEIRKIYSAEMRTSSITLFSPTPIKERKLIFNFLLSLIDNFENSRELFGLTPYPVHYEAGNCLFEAVAAATGQTGQEIRDMAVKYIEQNQELKEKIEANAGEQNTALRTTNDDLIYASFENYLELMSQDRTWGTEIEIYALANALQRPISVLTPENRYDLIFGEEYTQNEPIFLNYINNNHYVLLIDNNPNQMHSRTVLNRIRNLIDEEPHNSIANKNYMLGG